MNAHQPIADAIALTEFTCMGYLSDLTDEELLVRPVPGANHINWQVGHLIASEHQMIGMVNPDAMPELPEGFAEKYTKETATSNNADDFCSKDELLATYQAQRAGLLAALDATSAEDLDNPGPEAMKDYFPNWGSLFMAASTHWMMHAGQWAITRRKLGRPPLF